MNILNRLGLSIGNKTETNKGNRFYYAVAENYKMSSIELENIQLKDAINETMKASSEGFNDVIGKVKSGLSNIWDKILSIFEAIRKFIRSITDKLFKRKIKKDIETTKSTLSKASKVTRPNIKYNNDIVDTKINLKENEFLVRVNSFYLEKNNSIIKKLDNLDEILHKYTIRLLDNGLGGKGIIPAMRDYILDLDKRYYEKTLENFSFSNVVRSMENVRLTSNKIESFIKSGLESGYSIKLLTEDECKRLKKSIDKLEELYVNTEKNFEKIDKNIGDVIKKLSKRVKEYKEDPEIEFTDIKNRKVEDVSNALKELQRHITDNVKYTITIFSKLVTMMKVTSVLKK